MGVDLWVFQEINEFARATPWLHGPMVVYTNYGIVLLALLLLGGWWLARQQADPRVIAAALWAPVGMLAALGVNQPISSAVGEARPYAVLSNILVLAHRSMDPSFPSDHAVTAGAVAAGVLLVTRRVLAWVTVVAALLLAFSRVYVAAHYPHDVLAGLLLGAVVSVVGFAIVRGGLTRLVVVLQGTRLRPVLTTAPPLTPVAAAESAAR